MKTLMCFLLTAAVVTSQQLPGDLTLTCASVLCVVGQSCREVFNPTTGVVSGQCLPNPPVTGNENHCTSGQPLLVSNAAGETSEAFCGRGLNRMDCPSGYTCNISPIDVYAVCCQTTEKAGQCPAPVSDGSVAGICAFMCNDDSDCNDDLKCCKNECGGTVCKAPVSPNDPPTCKTKTCGPNQRCEMLQVQCITAPCNPIPTCVDVEVKAGECPVPVSDGSVVGICAFTCNDDSDCDGDLKCCKNECGGTVCRAPVSPNDPPTCKTKKCGRNQKCEMLQPQCPRAPCDPIPTCVDTEKEGVCPKPKFTWASLWRMCRKDCNNDWDCPNFLKCCKDYTGCGTTCEGPEPSNTCANVKCSAGQVCQMQQVQCIRAPCFDVPTCIDIAKACKLECKPGYKCELRWNRFTFTQEPICVFDHKNPVCSPACGPGYECQLKSPWWCVYCNQRPTCVRSRKCPIYPAWINPNCVRRDECSVNNPFACTGNTICCSTDCGRKCVTPLE